MLDIISGKINFFLRLKRSPTFNQNFRNLNRICTFFVKISHWKYWDFLKLYPLPSKRMIPHSYWEFCGYMKLFGNIFKNTDT